MLLPLSTEHDDRPDVDLLVPLKSLFSISRVLSATIVRPESMAGLVFKDKKWATIFMNEVSV